MGSCMAKIDVLSSKDAKRLEKSTLHDLAVMHAFDDLNLCTIREMERLYIAFDRIGSPIAGDLAGKKGVVATEDVIRYLGVTGSEFLDEIFTAPVKMAKEYEEFKRVEAGGKPKTEEDKWEERRRKSSLHVIPTMTFDQFCMSIWMLTYFQMHTLAFNMSDVDGSGSLDIEEVQKLVARVYGRSSVDGGASMEEKAGEILEGMDVDNDGCVTKAEFKTMSHKYHYLMLPAFELQNRVRGKVFGAYIDWKKEEEKRESTRYTTLTDIVKEIDRKSLEQVAIHSGDPSKLREKLLGQNFEVSNEKLRSFIARDDGVENRGAENDAKLAYLENKELMKHHR